MGKQDCCKGLLYSWWESSSAVKVCRGGRGSDPEVHGQDSGVAESPRSAEHMSHKTGAMSQPEKTGQRAGMPTAAGPTGSPVGRASSKSAWQAHAHTHASDADHSSKEGMRTQVCSKTLFYGLVGTQPRCKSLFYSWRERSIAVRVCLTAVPAALL